ncbi:hypothetical protein [Nocardiopsis sp. YSL2]|uniref:hypothetical protein n=1 Tax=Nocardiopsis sp. YSL2 TaxID=2939492 RepID=UPI0026F411B9|nr:hypothetical protein [Nocardiopsis sp. YSL2]
MNQQTKRTTLITATFILIPLFLAAGGVFIYLGLDSADKLASVLGFFLTSVSLFLTGVTVFMSRASSKKHESDAEPAQESPSPPASSGRNVFNGPTAVQIRGRSQHNKFG